MTSPPFPSGTDEHPEVAEISAFTEGQLAPDRDTAVRTHLGDCALCADVRASLDDIRGLLGTLPGPPRMPEDVASRIDAALAAEALLNATAPEALDVSRGTDTATGGSSRTRAANVSRETETTGDGSPRDVDHGAPGDVSPGSNFSGDTPRTRGRETRDDVSRETGHGARGRPPGRAQTATGPGRQRTARRWRTALIAAGALAGLGLGGVVMYGVSDTASNDTSTADQSTAKEAPEGQQDSDGGGDAATDALGKRVRALLADGDGPSDTIPSPRGETSQRPSQDSPLRGDGATSVPTCVREGIGRAETPIAADPGAYYRGSAAYLVVLPHVGDSRFVDAYVVDPDCTTRSAPGPGEVLTKRTYARD